MNPFTIIALAYLGFSPAVGVVLGWVLRSRRHTTTVDWPVEQTPAQSEATLREQMDIDHTEWHQISCRLTEDLVQERAPLHDGDFQLWATEQPTTEVTYS